MRKKVLTKAERLQLIGLLTLAHQAFGVMQQVDKGMIEIIGREKDGGDYADCLSDEYFESNPNVDDCLERMKIRVK